MSSEILSHQPDEAIAPVFWRVVHKGLAAEAAEPTLTEQLDQKFQEGRQRGLTEALAISRREQEAALQPLLQRIANSILELTEARQSVREETAADLVRLSITIASRILHREVTLDPDAIHGLLQAAFDKARSREITRVSVHPLHEAAVRSFLEQAANPTPVEIVANPRLECGAILFETAQGHLDASIEAQLKEIERGLADRIDR